MPWVGINMENKTDKEKSSEHFIDNFIAKVINDASNMYDLHDCEHCMPSICKQVLSIYKPSDSSLWCEHSSRPCKVYAWAVNRAKMYADHCCCDWKDVLGIWEGNRKYGYMNYYQDSLFLSINDYKLYTFESRKELNDSCPSGEFVCSSCGKKTKNDYICDRCHANVELCHLSGKHNFYVLTKDDMRIHYCFRPVELIDLYKDRYVFDASTD